MNTQNIGKKIAAMRQERSLTQQQLAALVYVSHQAVSKWENGQSLPDMKTMMELARIFGVTLEQLMDDDAPDMENEQPNVSEAQKTVINNGAEREAEGMNITQLIRMAPFMSKEAVGGIAMQIEENLTALQIARIAPYVSAECLEALMEKHTPDLTWDTLRRLAPFLRKDYVDQIAKEIADGKRSVTSANDDFNRTLGEIGKAFDGFGRDMGKAFDEIGKGVEQTVRKAIRFGGKVVNEMSSAMGEIAEEYEEAAVSKVRSERAESIRKRAFLRALEDGNWDWLGRHIEEIRGDAELQSKIAEKAKAAGLHDWICRYMGGYADEDTIEAAVHDGRWSWLGDNCRQFGAEIQQKIALAAMRAENWQWLGTYADRMKLDGCAFEIADKAMRSGATILAADLASAHLDQTQKNDLLKAAYITGNQSALDDMLELADEIFHRWMLLDLADQGKWDIVEKYADVASQETLEEACEKAVEQGNFDAIDMLDRFM